MKQEIDFVLFSCAGIPDSMWIATSVMLEATTKRCWRLLGPFLAFKMLSEAFTSLQTERLSLRLPLKSVFEAFLKNSIRQANALPSIGSGTNLSEGTNCSCGNESNVQAIRDRLRVQRRRQQ